MTRTIETSRSWPAEAPLGPMWPEWRSSDGLLEDDRDFESRPPVATSGVLLRWVSDVPAPRGMHARPPTPVRPPEVWWVGQERGIPRGSAVFLMNTGQAPGLLARGLVSRAPFLAACEDRVGTVGQHIGVVWLEVHSATTRIPLHVLVEAVPDWEWLPGEGSGVVLPRDLVVCVERVWTQWHHRPQRGRRVADWVRESAMDATTSHSVPGARSRRLATATPGLHLAARYAG